MVAYPYTKLMTSIMDVDMAAALVMASAAKADALGVPEEKRVYLRGWGYAEDPAHVAGHAELWRSPGLAAASSAALAGAGIGVDEVAHLDLYSCFASSICFALDTLGLAEDDSRGVTQTGGLPYHGGPGSNYMTHSLVAMAESLRADPGSYGLASGVGMHMQKHAFGVWSTRPRRARRLGGSHRGPDRERARPAAAPRASGSSPRRRDRPRSRRTRCSTAATARPIGRCWSATCPPAAAATRCSTAVRKRWRRPSARSWSGGT